MSNGQELLESLRKRAAHISKRIADLYKANFEVFEVTFDQSRLIREELHSLRDEFLSHADSLDIVVTESTTPSSTLAPTSAGLRSNRTRTESPEHKDDENETIKSRRSLLFLDKLVVLHDTFVGFDSLVEAGKYLQAAKNANSMKRLMKELIQLAPSSREFEWPNDTIEQTDKVVDSENKLHLGNRPSGVRILETARLEVSRKHARLCSRLEELFADTFNVGSEEVAMTIKNRHAGVHGHMHYDSPSTLASIIKSIWCLDAAMNTASQAKRGSEIASGNGHSCISPDSLLYRKLIRVSQTICETVLKAATSDASRYPEPTNGANWSRIQFFPRGQNGFDESSSSRSQKLLGQNNQSGSMGIDEVIDRILIVLDFIEVELGREEVENDAPVDEESKSHASSTVSVEPPADLARACLRVMGEEIWKPEGAPTQAVLNVIQEALPEDESLMPEFDRVAKSAERFELRLSQAGWLVPQSENHFAAFVSKAETNFIKKRRTHFLVKTRKMLIQDYHNSVVICPQKQHHNDNTDSENGIHDQLVGDFIEDTLVHDHGEESSLFSLPQMSITRCAYRLVESLHKMLSQCAHVSAGHARMLWQTARDMVELFRIIVPSAHGKNITNLPRIAMLFYCDCRYIAHHAMVIAHLYRSEFPPPLDQCASMVDIAPLVRSLGVHQFVAQIATQRREILGILIRLGDLSQLTDDAIGQNAETVVSSVLYHVSKLSKLWSDVLPTECTRDGPSVLHRAIGALVGVISTDMLSRLENLSSFQSSQSSENNHELQHLLKSLVHGCVKTFETLEQTNKSNMSNLPGQAVSLHQQSDVPRDSGASDHGDIDEGHKLGMNSQDLERFVPGWAKLLEHLNL